MDMREASCARAWELCFCAKLRTIRTASPPVDLAASDTCKNEAAPPVASMMISLALANAANSSPRLLVSASKSSAFVMQSWWRPPKALVSSARSLEETSRSPSATPFFSSLWALLFLASAVFFFGNTDGVIQGLLHHLKFVQSILFFLASF